MFLKKLTTKIIPVIVLIACVVSLAACSGDDIDATEITSVKIDKNGEKVQLVGFGTFEVKERSARTGRNPKTGETIEVAASKYPAFSASKALKDQLN